jgi:hypothetical protein
MTGAQAAWQVLSILLYPAYLGLVGLGLLALGVPTWMAYVGVMLFPPLSYLLVNCLVGRYLAKLQRYELPPDVEREWGFHERARRPLIR